MKIVEENKRKNLEKVIIERIGENIKLFNKEEINIIKNNKKLAEKIYLLALLDTKI